MHIQRLRCATDLLHSSTRTSSAQALQQYYSILTEVMHASSSEAHTALPTTAVVALPRVADAVRSRRRSRPVHANQWSVSPSSPWLISTSFSCACLESHWREAELEGAEMYVVVTGRPKGQRFNKQYSKRASYILLKAATSSSIATGTCPSLFAAFKRISLVVCCCLPSYLATLSLHTSYPPEPGNTYLNSKAVQRPAQEERQHSSLIIIGE